MAKKLIKDADDAALKAAKEAKTWKRELQLADKREKPWRDEADKIIKRYRGEEKKKNRFNVLWANTEILRPAIYNTKPNPDVRRRFRDTDPLGKAVSEVLERSLYVICDDESTEIGLRNDVLDSLLPGRGLSRVRYKAKLSEMEDSGDAELEFEQACVEHVDWRDYREGYARTWDEVPWVAFRHKLTKEDAHKQFDEDKLTLIEFTTPTTDEERTQRDDTSDSVKIAEFWEFWDKQTKTVFFTQEQAPSLLYPKDNPNGQSPIEFPGFFPCPNPLMLIENTGTRIPIPHFSLYQSQADELDKLSGRIDRIVDKLRLRGIYDSTLDEIQNLMDSGDNELVPVENAAKWMSAGGIEKAISWMPVEQAAQVLLALNESRDKQKAIIDELTGISDIIRGVTDANETYGAQQLKSNYASVRLQRMQKEVQRYARDLLRLLAVVVAEKFGPDTLAAMTDLHFPTQQEKQDLQRRAQQAQMPPQPGMPPPQPIDPALLQIPCWDEIMGLMRSDKMRLFRIDIETDSTIAGVLDSDMKGITEVMAGISAMLTEMGPIVQSGALPVDAAKELVMAVIRRARLGMAVEDAFEKMKAPQPPPPPVDHTIQVAQIKAQSDEKIAQMRMQSDNDKTKLQAQSDQMHQSLEAQRNQLSEQLKHDREQSSAALQAQTETYNAHLDAQKAMMLEQQKADNSLMEAKLEAAVKIIVAEIAAKSAEKTAEAAANREVSQDL